MTDTDKIDLSLQSNQNKIAVSLATFFTVDELEQIDLSDIKCIYSQDATHPCGNMDYSKKFNNDKEFKMHCAIDTVSIPNTHFTYIKIINGELYQSDFKCNPNLKNGNFLALIIKRAINYSKFKNFEDRNYNKQNIVRNFSDKMITDLESNLSIFEELKKEFLVIEDKCDKLHGHVEGPVSLEYNIQHVHVETYTINDEIFKFIYINTQTGASDFCYFLRGHVGLDMLIMIFDRAINRIKIESLDSEQF